MTALFKWNDWKWIWRHFWPSNTLPSSTSFPGLLSFQIHCAELSERAWLILWVILQAFRDCLFFRPFFSLWKSPRSLKLCYGGKRRASSNEILLRETLSVYINSFFNWVRFYQTPSLGSLLVKVNFLYLSTISAYAVTFVNCWIHSNGF